MSSNNKFQLAVFAGIFATGGAVCAKLAAGDWASLVKLALLAAMVTSNTIGCTLFVRALASSSSSLPATVLSSGVNYFCSALMGRLVFGEACSLRWCCGTALVLLGLVLICFSLTTTTTTTTEPAKKTEDEKEELLSGEKEKLKRQ